MNNNFILFFRTNTIGKEKPFAAMGTITKEVKSVKKINKIRMHFITLRVSINYAVLY